MEKRIWIPTVISIAAILIAVVVISLVGGSATTPNGGNSTPAHNTTANGSTNNTPPDTSTWISPGKVFIDNYVPGTSVEYELQVHNGNPHEATFTVDYRVPDHVLEGYERPTSEVRDWVRFSEKRPLLKPYETRIVAIRLAMPSTALVPGDKWEFWIGVIDQSQSGNVWTELCQRWLITMEQ